MKYWQVFISQAITIRLWKQKPRPLASSGGGGLQSAGDGGAQPNGIDCLQGYHKDPETGQCVPDNCPANYHWDGTTCVPDNSCPAGYHWNGTSCVVNSSTPPAPAPDAAVPVGNITVDETQQLTGLAVSPTRSDWRITPVRQARIVARRWFKVERVYTDASGHFQFTKRFKHKVRINVKFKNDDAVVRCLRGVRVWNTLSPLNKVIGVYNGNKSNITYNFQKYPDRRAKGNQYWMGGTVHNGIQEYKGFAQTEHIGLPPTKLYVLITNWASNGVTLMLHKRWSSYLPTESVQAFFDNYPASIVGGLDAVTNVVTKQIDISIGFRLESGHSFDEKHSDDVKEDIYHQLTHSAHYNALGNIWYTNFVNAEASAIITYPFHVNYSPYGTGTGTYSAIIALGESWAYYIGEFMTDLQYGLQSSQPQYEQPGKPFNNSSTASSHINVLEGFDPNYSTDPFDWIPQGLYEDLRDATNETNPITDNVSGYYTNQMFFTAFSSSITTMQGFRTNLLNQNTGTSAQATQVTALFNQYHY